VPTELMAATQDQAQGIYLGNAKGGSGKHDLQAISTSGRATAEHVSTKAKPVNAKDTSTTKARKEKRAAANSAGLTDAEYAAIATFTAQDYKYINPATANSPGWMKAQKDGANDTERNEMFDGNSDRTLMEEGSLHTGVATMGLKKLPVYDGEVFRGASLTPAEFEKVKKENGWSTLAMASASKIRLVAEGFAHSSAEKFPEKTIRVVYVLEDAQGREVETFSKSPGEKEVMLMADSHFVTTTLTQVATPKFCARKSWEQGTTWYEIRMKRKGGKPEED
jgi:hypothetical protein